MSHKGSLGILIYENITRSSKYPCRGSVFGKVISQAVPCHRYKPVETLRLQINPRSPCLKLCVLMLDIE